MLKVKCVSLMVCAAIATAALPIAAASASAGIPQNGSPASQCAAYVTAEKVAGCIARVNDGGPVHMSNTLRRCLERAGIAIPFIAIGGVIGGAVMRGIVGSLIGGTGLSCVNQLVP